MAIKVVSHESIPQFEIKVNELLAKGYKILSCGVHPDACWAILELAPEKK